MDDAAEAIEPEVIALRLLKRVKRKQKNLRLHLLEIAGRGVCVNRHFYVAELSGQQLSDHRRIACDIRGNEYRVVLCAGHGIQLSRHSETFRHLLGAKLCHSCSRSSGGTPSIGGA
jgi:hypothetical protein